MFFSVNCIPSKKHMGDQANWRYNKKSGFTWEKEGIYFNEAFTLRNAFNTSNMVFNVL